MHARSHAHTQTVLWPSRIYFRDYLLLHNKK